MQVDIAIVGGGVMGSALAFWLKRLQPSASISVIERDLKYTSASSALSAASIRQQFTTAVNIRISQASFDFLRRADEWLSIDDARVEIGLMERGYLLLAREPQLPALKRANTLQRANGADIALLAAAQLQRRFSWLNTSDLVAGSLGLTGEGWFDGYGLLAAFARKARSLGAQFLRGEVVQLTVRDERVCAVELADGTRIGCGYVVDAAGPWARSVARLAGVELPVAARRRTVYVIACAQAIEDLPLLVDPSGFWIRPEGKLFIAGIPPRDDADDAPLEPDYAAFESDLWPRLAERIPAFEAARLERAWAGYYDMNTFDHNGIVGFHPRIGNLLFINGFSGHGIQQSPVVARGAAELLIDGRFTTLDLSPLAYSRIAEGRPLREDNVIG
jgi:FAD-dependent oxidoreductase domain-containing protein 1